jgi:hypothetical protein
MQVRWRRIVASTLALGLVSAAIIVAPLVRDALDARRERLAAEPLPIPANDAQQAELTRALLATPIAMDDEQMRGVVRFYDSSDTRVLLDHTLALRRCIYTSPEPPPGAKYTRICPEESRHVHMGEALVSTDYYYRDIPLKWRRELLLANELATPLPDPRVPGVALVGDDYSTGPETRQSGANIQMIAMSRAVLTPDQRHALLFVETYGNVNMGYGSLVEFERTPSGWKVIRTLAMWMS